MSDDGKSPIGGTFEDIGEAFVPARDQVGQAIEAGIQSVIPPAKQQSPAQQQQKQVEDQQKLAEARRKIDWWKKLEEAQKKAREEEKQKQLARLQQEEEEKRKKQGVEVKKIELFQKEKQVNPEIAAKGKAEIKRGVGG